MKTGSEALILFYSFFWAVAIGGAARYELFDTASFFENVGRWRAVRRALVAFLLLTLAPVLWLWMLHSHVVPSVEGTRAVLAAAFASFSVFGFIRILHAFVATEHLAQYFYTPDQITQVHNHGTFKQPQRFLAHFGPGFLYLIVFPFIACWVAPNA